MEAEPEPARGTDWQRGHGQGYRRARAGVEAGRNGKKTGLMERTVGQETGIRGAGSPHWGQPPEIQWLCLNVPQRFGYPWSQAAHNSP